MINPVYKTKEYLESVLCGDNTDFITESLSESFSKASNFIGDVSAFRSSDFASTLIGAGIIEHDRLEVSFDRRTIPHDSICGYFSKILCNKMGICESSISVVHINKPIPLINLKIGDAVAHTALARYGSYGTLGTFLFPERKKKILIISNNHVLANANQAEIGDDIYYLDISSLPKRKLKIGKLKNFHSLSSTKFNEIDLAVAEIDSRHIAKYKSLRSFRQADMGERVVKTGATTKTQYGIIKSISYTTKVDYGPFDAVFKDQIQIIPLERGDNFSKPGDSGSGIYSLEDGAWIGMLFAGDYHNTFANNAIPVITQLKKWKIKIT